MENFYLFVVIILFILAISDLAVGVSNDAVNFLNSAIGSKVAPVKVILIIASLGVLIGATFSSGLMEVARKGIFHPDMFLFSEIMVIFVAVMLTDIILLDFFNTIGLPTSTTVSIVFELLGAAVAVSLVKISMNNHTILDLGQYINTDKAMAIIGGIFISVFIAFAVGAIVQYLSRLLFSFQYKKYIKYFGAVWGGIAIATITYFILIKGAKGTSFLPEQTIDWILSNTGLIILISFIGWSLILQIGRLTFKLDIPKLIVLVGTFALAMSFAGNDLVNFIGVPLAGLSSFQEYLSQGTDNFLMDSLKEPFKTNTYLLLLAGVIMIITLWTSKKARKVVNTEVSLGRQGAGEERFGSTAFSRSIVGAAISINNAFNRITPPRFSSWVESRFLNDDETNNVLIEDRPAFDKIRASVNLVIASALIALGTSLKLPLSTTFVTFMVAMGTSLSDRAWGRESAVYRITGVFAVIGGWFMTALIAFTVSLTFAFLIYFGELYAIIALMLIAVYFIYRTYVRFNRSEKSKAEKARIESHDLKLDSKKIVSRCYSTVAEIITVIPGAYNAVVEGLYKEDKNRLVKNKKAIEDLDKKTKYLKDDSHYTIELLKDDPLKTGHYYIMMLDHLRDLSVCLKFIANPSWNHIKNHHKGFSKDQHSDLSKLAGAIESFYKELSASFKDKNISEILKVKTKSDDILNIIEDLRIEQVKRIRKKEDTVKNSLLYLNILAESKNLILYTINLINTQKEFMRKTS